MLESLNCILILLTMDTTSCTSPVDPLGKQILHGHTSMVFVKMDTDFQKDLLS